MPEDLPSPQTPETVLKTVFGYSEFRPLQREVIANVLARRDTLAIMPTGGGKSLCYQIPALLFPGLTVVVSPLIALMKDQVEQLHALGIPALFLNSSLSFETYRANMAQVRRGEVRLLFAAPETLLTPRLFDLLASLPIDCLTIDEAHCISEWGHDFRPEYRQLAAFRRRFPKAVCLALTATATPRVREDIQDSLGFEESNEFIASFNRHNLLLEVVPKSDPAAQTLEFLRRFPNQSGIIYCFSRKQVDDLAAWLSTQGFSARPYHAGLPDEERHLNQELFIRDDVQIIVATIAFGMGINKPNVRFVVHYDLPKSIEGYYQEIGRAGRDGLPARCLLLYSYGDVQKLRYFIDQKEGDERRSAYTHLQALVRYAESTSCRRAPLMAYFGEPYTAENCEMCDNCLGGSDGSAGQVDITVPAQKFLSCVKRTGERFGAGHVVDVLLGAQTEKITRFGHQNLSTYGIGKDLSRKQWLHLGRQLVQQELLAQDDGQYPTLKLTPKAYEVLRTKAAILGVLLEEERSRSARKKGGEIEHDTALFELLRARRKALADEARVPPYVIFSDRTLVEMAAVYPQSEERLLQVNGVGQVKAERYGESFLAVIRAYCGERGLAEKPGLPASAPASAPLPPVSKPRFAIIGEAYNRGRSIESLMGDYGVQQATILDHLANYALGGRPLRAGEDLLALSSLPADRQAQALAAFAECGPERLKPVFDRLGGAVDYEELKRLRLVYLAQRDAARS
jgi:ATP-dependent DNA helicase RecQ